MKKKSDKSISTIAKEISNYFNNFFTSVAKKINKNIVKSKKQQHTYPTLAQKIITKFSFLQLYQRTFQT